MLIRALASMVNGTIPQWQIKGFICLTLLQNDEY